VAGEMQPDFFMSKGNGNRQHVLFECVAAAFFLLSQCELTKHDSAVQTSALLGQTPESVVGQTTRGQLAPASGVQQWLDGRMFQFSEKVARFKIGNGGWLIPASSLRAWLHERIFNRPSKVAGEKCSGTGQVVKESFAKEDVDWAETAAAQRPLAATSTHPIEVVNVPVGGLEPTTKASFTQENDNSMVSDTALTQTTAESDVGTEPAHDSG
jgi:hypothetical protein